MSDSTSIYTIGHSNHELDHFVHLLQLHRVQVIADVRSSPYSKFSPQFNRESLQKSLSKKTIKYVFLGNELGARRAEPECYLDNKVVYELVAKTSAFNAGVQRLIDGASKMRIALMCSEKDPLTCHRTILVARHLQDVVGKVLHILEDGEIEEHDAAERRLLAECKLQEPNFFESERERIQLAYKKRSSQIAYVEETEIQE